MNVLSLPDEMLASVLKYNSSKDLTAVRKVSSKIDSVARRYGMDKMKIDRLRITYKKEEVVGDIEVLKHRKEYRLTHPPSADLLEILKYYFSKIRGLNYLILNNYSGRTMLISNEVGEFLLGNGCKNITKLTIYQWEISIKFDTVRRIMTKLKRLYIRASFTEFEFSDAVIEGITFERLQLYEARDEIPLGICLPYLTRLCALKIPSTLRCKYIIQPSQTS